MQYRSDPRRLSRRFTLGVGLCLCAPPLLAQDANFQSPGMPWGGGLGQTTRFDNDFNPAISVAVDALADYTSFDGGSKDGLQLSLRRADFLAAAWVDPRAWAYATVAYHDGGELALEEAALEYIGLPWNHTLRAGRFFVDFGKQMQAHVEELRTVDRPLVLRTFLGEELGGDGLMWQAFTPVGDVTLVRWSLGAFQSLLPHEDAHDHGHGEEHDGAEPTLPHRADVDQLNYTARVTGMRDVGENGVLQLGASARLIPDFSYVAETEDGVLEQTGLKNSVFGADLTYGWFSDSGIRTWTLGGEWLLMDGDIAAHVHEIPGGDELEVLNDSVQGLFAFGDYRWSLGHSAGVQYSWIQEPEEGKPTTSEYDAYYTRWLSEFLRLRFAFTYADREVGEDSVRLAIQFTGVVGPHSHGVNW